MLPTYHLVGWLRPRADPPFLEAAAQAREETLKRRLDEAKVFEGEYWDD